MFAINSVTLVDKKNTDANSIDPDETANYEQTHLDQNCLQTALDVFTDIPLSNNGCVQIQRWMIQF